MKLRLNHIRHCFCARVGLFQVVTRLRCSGFVGCVSIMLCVIARHGEVTRLCRSVRFREEERGLVAVLERYCNSV